MTEKSYAERIILGLQAIGANELLDRWQTRKYRAFKIPGARTIFYVGKKGALRYGQTAATSFSAGNVQFKTRFYLNVLEASQSPNIAKYLKDFITQRDMVNDSEKV